MLDYKLQVFLIVASRLSFSKAADELHITQPAITRHIKQLEDHFNQRLFDRKGNHIALTEAGKLLVIHTKEIFKQHKELQFNMNALINKTEGILNIAASTTIAQYILPEILAKFHKQFPLVKVELLSANTQAIENQILKEEAQLGFIEGQVKNRELAYHPFMNDEIVLVLAKGHSLYDTASITLSTLKTLPIVLREKGSGTLQYITNSLRNHSIEEYDLRVEMHLGSSESIKSYLKAKESVAFLSVNTVSNELKTGDLRIIDIDDFSINRHFSYITKQGSRSDLAQMFINFISHQYNILL
ncbi:LysR substrate-binding domain-containing protein [Leeuwenhoekiella sp. NPDC079379]|uniref:LysR substrate-binding domain-containing protein n=1 Tax=Leeuwenhoekiella sp. NPDC079379 TaxID=3364122 RepID=UPI0037C8E9D8